MLQKTCRVDVDASGKKCREKMLSVLFESPVQPQHRRYRCAVCAQARGRGGGSVVRPGAPRADPRVSSVCAGSQSSRSGSTRAWTSCGGSSKPPDSRGCSPRWSSGC